MVKCGKRREGEGVTREKVEESKVWKRAGFMKG